MYVDVIRFYHECPHMNFLRRASEFGSCFLSVVGSYGILNSKGTAQELVTSIIMAEDSMHHIIKVFRDTEGIQNVNLSFKSSNMCGVSYSLTSTVLRRQFPELGHILYPVTITPEYEQWVVVFPDKNRRENFYSLAKDNCEFMKRRSVEPELVSKVFSNLDFIRDVLKIPEELTENQKRVLKEAYKEGFFETPKRIGLKEIAERRGASESAIMRTIRRGESKIISRIVKYM
ncbi:MAG: hypothetical protein PWR13_949 [Archaeoglobi archaeon]|nr:helix-turn-helix domain-containing protein [Candidatus Mnemosynella bozhongmuii]MDK2781921.1 hypothetical protein [Archaeoglobi archaeon]